MNGRSVRTTCTFHIISSAFIVGLTVSVIVLNNIKVSLVYSATHGRETHVLKRHTLSVSLQSRHLDPPPPGDCSVCSIFTAGPDGPA
jgi:hypothetical protein